MSESVKPLISLDPIGVGTPLVESLDSYGHRVAAAHRVPRVYVDMLITSGGQSLPRPKVAPPSININGPSEIARAYGQRIADLTGRPLAACLSLGVFSGVLSRISCQRSVRAWCSQCIQAMEAKGDEPYWPLVWSFKDYVVCHVHGTPVLSQCNSCLRTNPIIRPWKGPLFACRYCNAPLNSRPSGSGTLRKCSKTAFHEYNKAASHLLGELVSDVARIQLEVLTVGNNFHKLLQHVGEFHGNESTPAAVARLARLSKNTTHTLCHGKLLPSLGVLIRLASVFNVSISGLICADLWRSDLLLDTRIDAMPPIRVHEKKNWVQIRAHAKESVFSGNPVTPTELGRSLGVCPKAFMHKCTEDALNLRFMARKWREDQYLKKTEELAVKILAATDSLTSQSTKVSDRKISKMVGVDRKNSLYVAARKLTLH